MQFRGGRSSAQHAHTWHILNLSPSWLLKPASTPHQTGGRQVFRALVSSPCLVRSSRRSFSRAHRRGEAPGPPSEGPCPRCMLVCLLLSARRGWMILLDWELGNSACIAQGIRQMQMSIHLCLHCTGQHIRADVHLSHTCVTRCRKWS